MFFCFPSVDEESEDFECASVINSHTQDVKRVLWHPSKEILASTSYDDTIKMYKDDGDDWVCFCTLVSHESTVWSIDFNATGSHLVSVSDDRTVKIWKEYLPGNQQGISTTDNDPVWKCVCTLSGSHDRPIYDVSWCNNTGAIATACGDDNIRLFMQEMTSDPDEPSFSLVETIHKAHTEDVNSVKWNRKQPGLLASCSDDGDIQLWKFESES
ncbi:hypothetical protein LSH36_171g07023 [Paralvinella palmiformis]|uniref:Cytosolic iron-sulfur protein assembly protein CIAO1 homolog n=1 Tax=Paralvinella palmiformis TaxID=53620 RepID=A0AAD9JSX3_9ANNE|nr:hypothetical protein LSH36_171g07023 [Paralvinella palmiformis]